MKIAITSTGSTPQSKIDQWFGRCSYFAIYDLEKKDLKYLPNPNKEVSGGAGPASVQVIASEGVQKIVSGEFGIKIKPLLDSLKIQMIVVKDESKTVADIINMLENN